MKITTDALIGLALLASGCMSTPDVSDTPSCDLCVVVDVRQVSNSSECPGLMDGTSCLTLGADPVHLHMRDIGLAIDELGYPCVAFSISQDEREACNALARSHPDSSFVLVQDNRPYRHIHFAGPNPSTPAILMLVPSRGHWTAHEAEQERLRLLATVND